MSTPTTSAQPTSLAHYMQKQRELYVLALPDKIATLDAALQQLRSAASVDGTLLALAQAHKLAGSGGTFGLPAVSEAAAAIEKILSSDAAAQCALADADHRALAGGLQALREALAPAAPGLAAVAPVPESPSPEAPPSRQRPDRLIYIFEPDQPAARALASQLSQAGYLSRIFDRPADAAAQAGDMPEAILANIRFSADQHLLTGSATAGIPLILISGDTGFEARLEAVRAGAVGYFPELADVQPLLSLLERVTSAEPDRPYRVLIVEDDETLADFYAGVLQTAGIETEIITDPGQVLPRLVGFQPDLITCDIYMPRCNGIELAALIRQQQALVRIPIVFLSTETSLDKQAQALKQGGDDFIIKPVGSATLIAAAQSRARRYRSLLEAEDTLRISEERFRLVFETSLDGFIQCQSDGRVLSANQSACTMFRMSEQHIRAAGMSALIHADDPQAADVLLRNREEKFRGELHCVRGDGSVFPAEVSSSRHVSSQGSTQVSVILRDITERKQAEQQIMELNAELETRVERRTAELSAANQELQAFSHSLAHDLRQPYIAINGLTALLEKALAAGATERSKNYLDRIRAGVSQMNERTDSLLMLAQLSRTQIKREAVDLGAVAGQVLDALQQHDPARVVRRAIQDTLMVQADAKLTLHLMTILIGNAWKFSAHQDSAVVTVGSEPGPDGHMIYFVRDNGAGFDMAYVDKLFGAFQRLHSTVEFAGAGIGLAMARRIINRHGGRIWASSAPGEGASFYFTLGPGEP